MNKINIAYIIKGIYGLRENYKYNINNLLKDRYNELHLVRLTRNRNIGNYCTLKNDNNNYYYLETDTGIKILLFDYDKKYINTNIEQSDKAPYYNILPYYKLSNERGYCGVKFILAHLGIYKVPNPAQMNIFDFGVEQV